MARIRTIKPEFWTSEQVTSCCPNARMLFIGIWTFADDFGIIPFSAQQLKNQIFPADIFSKQDIVLWVNELIKNDLVKLYQPEDGKVYLWCITWDKHQKVDRANHKHPIYDPRFEIKMNQIYADIPSQKIHPDNSTSARRVFDDASTIVRRVVVESSPPEGNWKGTGREKELYNQAENLQFANQKSENEFLVIPENDFEEKEKAPAEQPVLKTEEGKKEKDFAQKEKKKSVLDLAYTPCQKTFLQFYQDHKRKKYLWSGKDGSQLKLLIGKLISLLRQTGSEPTVKTIETALLHLLLQLPSLRNQWIFENLSIAILSSKFNEITDQIINNNNKINGNSHSKVRPQTAADREDYITDLLTRTSN